MVCLDIKEQTTTLITVNKGNNMQLNLFDLDGNGTKLDGHYDVILIDGSHLLHRSMAAFSGLGFIDPLTETWIPTGAIFGFLSLSVKVFDRWAEPGGCKVIFCWEGGAAERRKLFPEYKGNRRVQNPDPDEQLKKDLYFKEMFSQQDAIMHLTEIAGWKSCRVKGWEADDALGTLAHHYEKLDPENRIAIYSGDGDMHQCVTDRIHVIAGGSGRKGDKVFNKEEVLNKWGVEPCMVAPLKGLAGDGGDNIPGVAGCGSGWAAKMLTQYGSCQAVIDAAKSGVLTGEYKGKKWTSKSLTPKIASAAEQILLSQDLATIRKELEFEIKTGSVDEDSVKDLLEYYQIRSVPHGKLLMIGYD